VIEDLAPGDHVCSLCETEDEHRALFRAFLRQGIERGEKVMYIAQHHSRADILGYLRADFPDVEQLVASGQLSIVTPAETYLRGGPFDPDKMIALLRAETEKALAESYAALRMTGEMAWLLDSSADADLLIQYEAKLNAFFPGSKCLGICQYDQRRFDAPLLLNVLATHPTVAIGTGVFDNFYYMSPEEFLGAGRPAATLHNWLKNLKTYKQTAQTLQAALEESQHRQIEVSALLQSSRAILELRDFKQAARSIFDNCKRLTGAAGGYVALLSKDGKENETLVLDPGDLPCNVDPTLPTPIRGLAKEAYRTGRAVYHNDFSRSEWVGLLPNGHMQLKNVLFAPMMLDSQAVGLIGLANKPGGFTEDDALLATAFGELAAVALLNSRTLEARENSEARFRSVVQTAHDAIINVNSRGTIVFWNRAAEATFGYTAEEILGKPLTMLMPEQFHAAHLARMARHVVPGRPQTIVRKSSLVGRRKDGTEFPMELSVASWKAEEGLFFSGIIRDITERKQAEDALRKAHDDLEKQVQLRTAELAKAIGALQVEVAQHRRAEHALRASEARYREMFENAAYGIYRVTPDGRFLDANPALVAMLGYGSRDELLALNMATDIYRDPSVRSATLAEIQQKENFKEIELAWKRKDGTLILVRASGQVLRDASGQVQAYETFVEDITQRHALEKQIAALQKFDAIGKLAGGIAHDFNNVIAAVMGWAELGLEQAPADSALRSHFQRIFDQADRAAGLTRQLLAFARRQVLDARNLNLNQTVTDVLKLLEKVIGENIEIRTTLSPDLATTRVDPAHIEQVLMNLCFNARDAMPRGGRLLIETQNTEVSEDYCRVHTYAKPGSYVLLNVSDTGVGMDADTLDHIFEPFFTTKQLGKGTGLGLATVYGIVKQHGGFINAYSEPGHGTTFRVYLPAQPGPAEVLKSVSTSTIPTGTETLLLAEDHEGLRELAREILGRLGYTVLLARDGEEAVAIFRAEHDRIALVLLDVVMPRLGGPEAYRYMSALKPELPVIFSTGYTTEIPLPDVLAIEHAALLQKPYDRVKLAQSVRQLLDSAHKPGVPAASSPPR
jgi:PAS domain S-box-containing protein